MIGGISAFLPANAAVAVPHVQYRSYWYTRCGMEGCHAVRVAKDLARDDARAIALLDKLLTKRGHLPKTF